MLESESVIYLDNAATTYPKPECVYQAADEFYQRYGGNAGRGANPLAREGAELIAETRSMLVDCLGVSSPERVILLPSATIALNLAILGARLHSGDVVFATPFEHNSVLRPLEHLRHLSGIEVREIPFNHQTMACQLDQLASQFRIDPPMAVCVTQASNVCGVMPPVIEIARLARNVNPDVIVIVDGSQVAGLYPLPLEYGLIDAYIFSGHKSLYGPYGVAGLVLASDWQPSPILFGGTGTASESVRMPLVLPSAYEVGSHNVWAIAGLRAALRWLEETGREAIVNHTLALSEQLRSELERLSSVQVYVPAEGEPWCGIISFACRGVSPQTAETVLAAKGMAVRAGLHCAPWAHRWLDTARTGGTVRLSMGWFLDEPQITAVLKEIVRVSEEANF